MCLVDPSLFPINSHRTSATFSATVVNASSTALSATSSASLPSISPGNRASSLPPTKSPKNPPYPSLPPSTPRVMLGLTPTVTLLLRLPMSDLSRMSTVLSSRSPKTGGRGLRRSGLLSGSRQRTGRRCSIGCSFRWRGRLRVCQRWMIRTGIRMNRTLWLICLT
jgi:hypothetical protein